MNQKRPSIPLQVEAFRRPRRWKRWFWVLAAGVIAVFVIWLVSRSPSGVTPSTVEPVGAAQEAGPPWQLGNPEGRFTLTLYADLECPFCRSYFPQLKRWAGDNADVVLQWQHLPLAAHEPAASTEARLAECAGESGGHAAFWQTVEWVYTHTRSDGQGLPDGLRYPDLTPAIEQCLASERASAVIHAQAAEAMNSGVTATPSVRLHDRQTGKAVLLQGPIEGDSLLSAMDMLAADEPDTIPVTEMPADVVGDMPR
ncbi:DsbA family protein [Achromobacter anxifer]|uniref:DsbA family protein n=1 Tax=Achromobacter anxifer TaxID=1287737 RepID=UPI0023F9A51E|nr:thioredoxin domain-containing protein [Achromobacter anxifer]MDF8361305.1 thioredoxin domain-containing protein [Achromobacter anxifer]